MAALRRFARGSEEQMPSSDHSDTSSRLNKRGRLGEASLQDAQVVVCLNGRDASPGASVALLKQRQSAIIDAGRYDGRYSFFAAAFAFLHCRVEREAETVAGIVAPGPC